MCFKIYREVNLDVSVRHATSMRFELSKGAEKLCTNNRVTSLALEPFPAGVPLMLSSNSVQLVCLRKHSRGGKVISLEIIFRAFFCQLSNDRA